MAYLRVLLLVFIAQKLAAQITPNTLSQDPVFRTVLAARLVYPFDALYKEIYARVYAGFEVDEKGHLFNISILNHMSRGTRYGFEPNTIAALKKLPPLNPHYQGRYILPIAFIYVDSRHLDNPYIPKDSISMGGLANYILLDEIKVIGGNVDRKERLRAVERTKAQ
ncbi:hypothetical protein [Spirosoma aerolatum]|uniref:hypothetical protein n=1 Tax=Spirosoma aerolatum TaxID=1211326 RepID=UPI0009AC8011|nr:hypothetical protein [Spirosoma aerolatum]